MTASTLITDYIGSGLFANRPTTPPVASGAVAFYYATDTGVLYKWSGAAWGTVLPIPTLVQSAFVRGTTGSQTSFPMTLPAPPTPGNLLVIIGSGAGSSTLVYNPPTGFVSAGGFNNSPANQGGSFQVRVAQSGDSATWTPTVSNPNGGQSFGIFEFANAKGYANGFLTGGVSSTVFSTTLPPSRTSPTSYMIGVFENDSINGYSSVVGASLLFDGTGSSGGTVNHPSVFVNSSSFGNISITYTGSSFGTIAGWYVEVR